MQPFFLPHVGTNYAKTGLLVLGESHYCNKLCRNCGHCGAHPECANFTTNVIRGYLNPNVEREGWMNTYLKFERSLVGHKTNINESSLIWDEVAFYNYLQVPMKAPRQAGTKAQYKQSEDAFFSVLETLRPQLMIVWGKRLWHHLPYTYWSDSEPLIINFDSKEHEEVGYYTLPSGHVVHALGVYHPSAAYSWNEWYNVIETIKKKINYGYINL